MFFSLISLIRAENVAIVTDVIGISAMDIINVTTMAFDRRNIVTTGYGDFRPALMCVMEDGSYCDIFSHALCTQRKPTWIPNDNDQWNCLLIQDTTIAGHAYKTKANLICDRQLDPSLHRFRVLTETCRVEFTVQRTRGPSLLTIISVIISSLAFVMACVSCFCNREDKFISFD
jgi:hypothetical protein